MPEELFVLSIVVIILCLAVWLLKKCAKPDEWTPTYTGWYEAAKQTEKNHVP